MTPICIEAIDYALPSRVVTNADLGRENPGWDMARVLERSGVSERRVAEANETALDLGLRACEALAERGELRPGEIGALVFCTETPDYPLPPNSTLLHARLGLPVSTMAFDITLACSGFVYAIGIARSLIQGGVTQRVLVVTADTYSKLIHRADRGSRTLFGDGGAATIVGTGNGLEIIDIAYATSGAQADRFIVRGGGARMPRSAETAREQTDRSGNVRTAEHIQMDGLGVLSFFNSVIPSAVRGLLARNGLEMDDVGCFVFHQASKVAVEGVARGLGIDVDRLVLDIGTVGNLVSASIPVALRRAMLAGRVPVDRPLVLCGFGVGLSWATALVKPNGAGNE